MNEEESEYIGYPDETEVHKFLLEITKSKQKNILFNSDISHKDISLEDVREQMKVAFKSSFNSPEKLLQKIKNDKKKVVLIATRCSNCGRIFFHFFMEKDDVKYYKNSEWISIEWDYDGSCPLCGSSDCLFYQHHTGKVVFDNTGIPDVIIPDDDEDKEKILRLKKPLIEVQ